ncbi:MAG: amidohydrolase family protein [Actinomycetota bacterium]
MTDRFPMVDTHVHLWDLQHPDMRYVWLEPGAQHPHLTSEEIETLASRNESIDDFLFETRHADVPKIVHVQAAVGIENPVKETEWLQAAAGRTGFPQAIVGHASLQSDDVREVLEGHMEYANFRGIRDFGTGDYLVDPAFHRGFEVLDELDLVFSLDSLWESMGKGRDLAVKFPETTVVLDHMGYPQERTDEYFENWRKSLRAIAEADNVVCKISEVGMADKTWTYETVRPWVLECIDVFGPDRCMFGTNWPVDRLYASYDGLVDSYRRMISDFSDDEQKAMLAGNAEQLYRI